MRPNVRVDARRDLKHPPPHRTSWETRSRPLASNDFDGAPDLVICQRPSSPRRELPIAHDRATGHRFSGNVESIPLE